jgi:hypothetical protein
LSNLKQPFVLGISVAKIVAGSRDDPLTVPITGVLPAWKLANIPMVAVNIPPVRS